jgi:transposase
VCEGCWSCGDLAGVGGFDAVFKRDACGDFDEAVTSSGKCLHRAHDRLTPQVSTRSPTGATLKYIAKYWDSLILFLIDDHIEMNKNAVERIFAGHDASAQNGAMLASLIETCKLNKAEPHGYITGVLTAIVNGHKPKDIGHLLPWNFKA